MSQPSPSEFLAHFQNQRQRTIDMLTELVNFETPTTVKASVDALGSFMEQQFLSLGASSVSRIPQEAVGDFLLAKWNEDSPGHPIMFLIHIDTVWPLGTLAERPPTITDEGAKLYGPGAIDMKGGITIVLTALRGLNELGQMPARPIWVLMTSDEEVGSIYSQPVIEELAPQVGLVLVMEPATPDDALKTWRKGVSNYVVKVEGRPSHAGNAPEQGINAIVELAQQTMKLQSLNDLKNGTSVSVTVIKGGSATNVIPAYAEAHVDVRTMTAESHRNINAAILGLEPFLPGAKVSVEMHHARGPMERNAQMQATFGQCKAIGESLGLTIREEGSGGGSDGNITAHLGIATLDGLGAQGEGLHALHEHVVINSLPRHAALIAAMLRDWKFAD